MNSDISFKAFIEKIFENIKITDIFKQGKPNTNHILIAKLAKKGYDSYYYIVITILNRFLFFCIKLTYINQILTYYTTNPLSKSVIKIFN